MPEAEHTTITADPNEHGHPVILHLSDLHFGYDGGQAARRENALRELVKTVAELDQAWLPSVVCISGDIAMYARDPEYDQAAKWLVLQRYNSLQ